MSSTAQQPVIQANDANNLQRNVFVRILEEPASKALRFRYECEGRSAGSLPGANSTQDKKSFPKIQVLGYRGRAVVVVSCVTIDPPFKPHPHNLVGKEGCKKGVCTMEIANEDMTCEFSNLGIQCVKKKDIEDSLKIREEIRVDPFRTGFHHKSQPGSIDLNSVRLCFQVFLEGPERGQFKVPLKPVVSEPIYDKKAINDLTIMKLSECSSPVMGNREIILLCDKVSKDDIEVRFYEENQETGSVVWESFGDFQPSDVHKQYAICFRTPQYHNLEITSPANVYIQLRCPSKDTTSAPRPFSYLPLLTSGSCKRKWNLVSFSGAYGSYMTNANATESPSKKIKPVVELEDILASENSRDNNDASMGVVGGNEPIYDRLNQFMGVAAAAAADDAAQHQQATQGGEGGGAAMSQVITENVYDVDLELISQIIKGQQDLDGDGVGLNVETIGDPFLMDVDFVNGNMDGIIIDPHQLTLENVANLEKVSMKIEQQTENGAEILSAPHVLQEQQQNNAMIIGDLMIPQSPSSEDSKVSTPPVRPPKQKAPQPPVNSSTGTGQPPPPLPPKKTPTTPTKSPTKSGPATFFKNLFSPTKKKQQQQLQKSQQQNVNSNVNLVASTQQQQQQIIITSDPQSLHSSTTTLTNPTIPDQSGGLIGDMDLKRKRHKFDNSRIMMQHIESNKRPRQNSYPPPTTTPPQHSHLPPAQTPPSMLPQLPTPAGSSQQPPTLHSPMQSPPHQLLYNAPTLPPIHQPIQLPSLHPSVPSPLQQQPPPIYIKQEPIQPYSPQQQYYYDMVLGPTTAQQQQPRDTQQPQPLPPSSASQLINPVQYSGGGIIMRTGIGNNAGAGGADHPEDPNGNNPDVSVQLNSDFSLPNLSDVNLSLLDQHLSENLNDMNLNNF